MTDEQFKEIRSWLSPIHDKVNEMLIALETMSVSSCYTDSREASIPELPRAGGIQRFSC